jgi:hypothetical protein
LFGLGFFAVLGLELMAFTLSHSASPFCDRYFWDRVSQTICLGWLWTAILLISAYWVARITGVSHRCLACCCFFNNFIKIKLTYRRLHHSKYTVQLFSV